MKQPGRWCSARNAAAFSACVRMSNVPLCDRQMGMW
jgi:hypothetical protein